MKQRTCSGAYLSECFSFSSAFRDALCFNLMIWKPTVVQGFIRRFVSCPSSRAHPLNGRGFHPEMGSVWLLFSLRDNQLRGEIWGLSLDFLPSLKRGIFDGLYLLWNRPLFMHPREGEEGFLESALQVSFRNTFGSPRLLTGLLMHWKASLDPSSLKRMVLERVARRGLKFLEWYYSW